MSTRVFHAYNQYLFHFFSYNHLWGKNIIFAFWQVAVGFGDEHATVTMALPCRDGFEIDPNLHRACDETAAE